MIFVLYRRGGETKKLHTHVSIIQERWETKKLHIHVSIIQERWETKKLHTYVYIIQERMRLDWFQIRYRIHILTNHREINSLLYI